ncbi:unnamed protein product [Arctia plantaginis]|uniref:Transmembrane protein 131 n=1 Tax=Arctia plantaginis TaxID=874455 RepID=A0A8S1A6S9_ARCPL|nr:unnamed protein product [Arctia plantaginis]
MYRKIVWCYVFILTLLDISLNTKLSAQGKSHGVTVHDSLIEGITFQEWGKESVEEGAGRSGGPGAGRAVSAGALSLSPPSLEFGRAALAAAHALTVTLTNTANTTMHLASVAGTTPDFHASFFESKTLPPQANTTFSVVYLGRREGPVSAHLYIHTSLGVHKYPVSAVGVASEWGVWPLVGVRVPLNATVEPLLTMHNPTDQTIQVSEVYSSGSWLGLQLPDGGAAAPRAAWTLAPGATRALVRLRLAPHHHTQQPHHSHHAHPVPLTAYIRIKANITGGGLVVCVEARSAAPGEFASPLQLRLRTRGSRDPADLLDISLGNSGSSGVSLEAGVWAARCAPAPPAPPPPPPLAHAASHNGETKGTANGNGVKSEGVYVSLTRSYLEPHQQLTHAAQLTLDYAKMWAGYGGPEGAAGRDGAWCGGWVSLGRAAVPYSVRVLPGTMLLTPDALHFVTSNREEALSSREVRVRNEFPVPIHISSIDFEPDVEQYFEVESSAGQTVPEGASGVVARVRLRSAALDAPLRTKLVLRTNLSDYTLPLLVYSGRLDIEWEWPNSADGTLRLGTLGASSTRRVSAALVNRGVTPLCVLELGVALPGAQLGLHNCAEAVVAEPAPDPLSCRCVAAGSRAWMRLTVVAPARAGALSGHVQLRASPPGAPGAPSPGAPAPITGTQARVELAALPGRLHAHTLTLANSAPYAWSSAPLVLESSMALGMRVADVTLPPDNPALFYLPSAEGSSEEVSSGRHAVGTVLFAAEKLCEPDCYTGLDIDTPEGAAWERRGAAPDEAALRLDAALQAARHALYARNPRLHNVSLHVHTTRVVQIPVTGTVNAWWPRLAVSPGDAGLAGVGGAVPLKIRVRNPSRSHPLLVQPVVGGPLSLAAVAEAAACRAERCACGRAAFRLVQWRAARGAARTWRVPHNATSALPVLLLAPDAEIELKLTFAPREAAPLTAYLYLRNNLTIMEGVQLSGRGAYPSFEIGGRRPGTNSPLLFEVSECVGGGATVRRTVVARNTGRVRVRLRDWLVAGEACQARGFRLSPCAALSLAPNESRPLTLAFTADWTLAKVHATLDLKSELGRASFPLAAAAPARLLAKCGGAAPRPPWEPALRAAGALAALAALALVLAAAALDAERELRRARAQRPPLPPPAARQPLDLRALAHEPQAPPQPVPRRPPPRRRRPPRPPADPAAERRAFERWRRDVLGAQDDDERSSEDNDRIERSTPDDVPPLEAEAFEPVDDVDEAPGAANDGYEADPETEDRPPGGGDEDAASTGSGSASASSSSPVAEVDEADDGDERDRSPRSRPRAERNESPVATPRAPPADASARPCRQPTPRRSDRSKAGEGEAGARGRPAACKAVTRKAAARRRSRPASPARAALRPEARAPGALRWGASWSSVVAARPGPAPLAPIGSDVRRRTEPAPDHSLFYFNGDPAHAPPREPDFAWRPPPRVDRPAFSPARDPAFSPARDPAFLDEPVGATNGSYRSMNSVWGGTLEPRPAAAAWLWGGLGDGAAVRPPPGFGAPPRPVRPYDPFRSLASIWAPGALDWRADEPTAADEPGAPH